MFITSTGCDGVSATLTPVQRHMSMPTLTLQAEESCECASTHAAQLVAQASSSSSSSDDYAGTGPGSYSSSSDGFSTSGFSNSSNSSSSSSSSSNDSHSGFGYEADARCTITDDAADSDELIDALAYLDSDDNAPLTISEPPHMFLSWQQQLQQLHDEKHDKQHAAVRVRDADSASSSAPASSRSKLQKCHHSDDCGRSASRDRSATV
jgi:hypothetical protein